MKIKKIKDVKTPTRGTSKSAGIDFYIPNDFKQTILHPQNDIRIHSGILVELPINTTLIAFNKSGVSLNKKLQVGACVIDEDYRDEISLHVFNYSNKPIVLNAGDKLVQFILIKTDYVDIELSDNLWESEIDTERKGGFGSTGTGNDVLPFTKDDHIKNKMTNNTVVLIKQGPTTESIKTSGYYSRHIFKDIQTKELYILDVSHLCPQFLKLNVGDVITNIITFTNQRTNKKHINGSSHPIYLGHYDEVIRAIKSKEKKQGIVF